MSKVYITEMNIEIIVCDDCHKPLRWNEEFYTDMQMNINHWTENKPSKVIETHYHNQCGPYPKLETNLSNEQYTK